MLSLIYTRLRKGDEDYFSQKLLVCIEDNKNSPHGKFHRFLFPFSDLNFASYVLYNLLVLCHVSHTVSLGYLWLFNDSDDVSDNFLFVLKLV